MHEAATAISEISASAVLDLLRSVSEAEKGDAAQSGRARMDLERLRRRAAARNISEYEFYTSIQELKARVGAGMV